MRHLICSICSLWIGVSACTHLTPPPAPEDSSAEEEKDGMDSALDHPAQPTADATRELLLTHAQPKDKDLEHCNQQLKTMGTLIIQEDDMVGAKKNLVPDVKSQRGIYHWCFYQNVQKIDESMDKPGISYEDKAKLFYEKMKELWPLARALDQEDPSENGGKLYFRYLRKRYIDISQTVFGRQLDVMGKPIDEPPSSATN